MSDVIITVSQLGKKYRIRHNAGPEGHRTLREVITESARKLFAGGRKPAASGQPGGREDFWALKDVSFEIKRGEVVGIIGRNGAGKSTLLKILSRITEPTEGRVHLRGRVASLLEVGTGFHQELTGRENIFLNGAILGMTQAEIKKKFDEIVAFAEVEKFLDTPVKRYSSGMYVRLAFAVAAHLEPEILVVDEVLAVGDAQFQKKCLGKMGQVAKGGRTVLFVSHNLAMIKKLCATGVLLENGRLAQIGSSEAVASTYQGRSGGDQSAKSLFDLSLASNDANIQVRSVEIFGEQEDSPPRTGGALSVKLQVLFRQKMINPGFIIRIRSIDEQSLIYLSTSPISGISTGRCEGLVVCTLRLNEVQLTEGAYEISVGVSTPNICYLIPVTPVGTFLVEGDDCYRSGCVLNNRDCFLAPKHEWIISHRAAQ